MSEEKENSIKNLSQIMPEKAIQKTKKEDTRKGYDTTGYGYQYCVNRFNEELGEAWGFQWDIIKETQGKYRNGTPYWELTVSLGIWVNKPEFLRQCVGGHISVTHNDALKGAITNAFKKTAAFWGVGKDAYEGTIDDDNEPFPEGQKKNNVVVPDEIKLPDNAAITKEQLKAMNETMKRYGWVASTVKEKCKKLFKVESSMELNQKQYKELLNIIETDIPF